MPSLADGMQEGTLLAWLIGDGEVVGIGDDLAEIETDKATMTYEAEDAGRLHTLVEAGESVAVGVPIAQLLEAGESPLVAVAPNLDGVPPLCPVEAPASEPGAERRPALVGVPATDGPRIKASPVARRLARERAVDLTSLMGSGPRGRILKQDVLSATAGGVPLEPARLPTVPAEPERARPIAQARSDVSRGAVSARPLTRPEQIVARRMVEAKAAIPEFVVTTTVDLRATLQLRDELRGVADPLPTINDVIVRACGIVLRRHPRLNSSFDDGQLLTYERINVGIAVATEQGLFVPTVFDADRTGLQAIAVTTRELASAVRDGSVSLAQLGGGTFTVSNLGMYGAAAFTAIINPPQSAILAVAAAQPAAPGDPESPRLMNLTLTCDHRIVYGAHAAQFLADLRDVLERPAVLTL